MMSILLIEDCAEDVEALTRTLRKLGVSHPLTRCETGEEALDYLHRRGAHATRAPAPLPSLIMLDLNLPGIDGRDILCELKADAQLGIIPVVIFSGSENPRDVDFCYRHGASGYLVKPMGASDLQRAVRSLIDYWFGPHFALPSTTGST